MESATASFATPVGWNVMVVIIRGELCSSSPWDLGFSRVVLFSHECPLVCIEYPNQNNLFSQWTTIMITYWTYLSYKKYNGLFRARVGRFPWPSFRFRDFTPKNYIICILFALISTFSGPLRFPCIAEYVVSRVLCFRNWQSLFYVTGNDFLMSACWKINFNWLVR